MVDLSRLLPTSSQGRRCSVEHVQAPSPPPPRTHTLMCTHTEYKAKWNIQQKLHKVKASINAFYLILPFPSPSSPLHLPHSTYTCQSPKLQRPAYVPHPDRLHSKELLKFQGRSNVSACHHFTFVVCQGRWVML